MAIPDPKGVSVSPHRHSPSPKCSTILGTPERSLRACGAKKAKPMLPVSDFDEFWDNLSHYPTSEPPYPSWPWSTGQAPPVLPLVARAGTSPSVSRHSFWRREKEFLEPPDIFMFCPSKLKPIGCNSQKLHFSGSPSLHLAVPSLGCAIFPCQGHTCSPESTGKIYLGHLPLDASSAEQNCRFFPRTDCLPMLFPKTQVQP